MRKVHFFVKLGLGPGFSGGQIILLHQTETLYGEERVVRILLECFLVKICSSQTGRDIIQRPPQAK